MKTKYILRLKQNSLLFLSVIFFSTLLFNSCKDDDNNKTGTPYFNIEGDPTGLSVDVKGSTTSYVVRSNRNWKVVAQEESDWVKVFADEGEDDGIFKIIVSENLTFDKRIMNFSFVVDGKEEPVLFRVEQDANVPFLEVIDADAGITVIADGGDVLISLKANVDWTYSLDNDSWLAESDKKDSQLKLIAEANEGIERAVTVTFTSPSYPNLSAKIKLIQSSGSVILEEDFSWLVYGNVIPYETTGEKRFDTWTEEEKNKGWEVTPNPGSGGQQLVYARTGFVKLGKTNYGSDLISPKLKIEGTRNVEVTFKAAGYISAGGAVDDNVLKISVLGTGTANVSQLIIDNIPNSRAQDEEGIVNNIWDPERAYSFIITGATSETQIRFLGGDLDLVGVGQGKNRIFLDDIKVKIIQD